MKSKTLHFSLVFLAFACSSDPNESANKSASGGSSGQDMDAPSEGDAAGVGTGGNGADKMKPATGGGNLGGNGLGGASSGGASMAGAPSTGGKTSTGGSASTGGSMSTGGDTSTGGGDANPTLDCDTYCEEMMQTCTGDNEQFFSKNSCLGYCTSGDGLATGAQGEKTGATIACRMSALGSAKSGVNTLENCRNAGPSGNAQCGTWCENYCDSQERTCQGNNALFADKAACMTGCSAYPDGGTVGSTASDDVQCRIAHLVFATSDASVHCAHASPSGSGVCVAQPPTCQEYCATVVSACTGDNAAYADEATCMNTCSNVEGWRPGNASDTSGNSIGCRLLHADAAESDPAFHCPIAGPSGGQTCIDD